MPLPSTDPDFKSFALQKLGYNPSQYDLDNDGNVISKVQSSPNVPSAHEPVPDDGSSVITKPPQNQTSSLGAFTGHAVASALPTGMGIGTGAAIGSLFEPGLGTLIGALMAGGAAGYGTEKAQNALMPDSMKEGLAQEQQEHPIASKLGDLAPSAAFFNPIKGAMEAPGVIGSLGKSLGANGMGALTAAEREGLQSAFVNVGAQTGMGLAGDLATGQKPTVGGVATDAATGLLFNSPWGLGAKMFPHSPDTSPPVVQQNQSEPMGGAKTASPIPVSGYGGIPENMGNIVERPHAMPEFGEPGNAMYGWKEGQGTLPQQEAMVNEGGLDIEQPSNVQTRPSQEPIVRLPQSTPPQSTPPVEAKPTPVESTEDLQKQGEEGQEKWQPENTKDEDISTKPLSDSDPRYVQAVADLAKRRGINLVDAEGLINGDTGEPVRGAMNQKERVAKVNPAIATEDTPVHEVAGHGFVDDLEQSKFATDRALAQRGKSIFNGNTNEAEEYLASRLGVEGAQRLQAGYGTKSEQAKLWFKDFISRWKNTLGMANDQDVINHLARRAITDAPYGSRGEVGGGVSGVNTGVKNQENNTPKEEAPQDKGQASRLTELNGKYNLTPEELKEKGELQSKSDSLKGKWKFQEEPFQLGSTKEEKASTKEPSALPFSSLPGFRSQADVIQAKDGERALPALKAAGDYYNEKDTLANKWTGAKEEAWKGIGTKDRNLMELAGIKGVQKGIDTTSTLPTRLQEPFQKVKGILKSMQQDAIDKDQPVMRGGVPSTRKIDPNYWPQQYDPNAVMTMRSQSPEGERLRKIQMDYDKSKGMTDKEAQEHLNNIITPNSKTKPDLSHFRGLDIEQGIGVPPELQRPGADRNLERYFNRYATGRSFHDNIEAKPDIAPLFGIKKDPWGKDIGGDIEPLKSKESADLLSTMRGESYHPDEGVLKASEGIATAGMLGPPTSMHIMMSSLLTSLSHAKPGEQFSMLKAGVSDISGALKRAYTTGLNRYKPTLMRDFLDAHSTTAEKLNSIRDLVSAVNGRDGISRFTNAMVQNMGEYLVKSRLPLADMGDKQSIRLMQNLDPTWHQGKVYDDATKLQLAANFARLVHGAHDFRTMPSWMLKDNIIHPFVSLMSWNIAQTNSFFKHVVTPAVRDGNYVPLITSTLGASIGGYLISNARQTLTNKKSPIPSLEELAKSSRGLEGNIPLIAYNFAAMSSYAGYAGILSTIARDAMDAAYKNPMQGAVFPLDEAIGNSGATIAHAVSAVANSSPDEYFDIGTKAVGDLLRENIQLARMTASWGDQAGVFGKERQEKKGLNVAEGDLRRWKTSEGMPVNDESDINQSNPYLNMGRKEFQHTQDIGEAAQELPGLIDQAWNQSGGNMEVLRSKLKALKQESYPSMPSPEQTPMTFWKYVEYLKSTQGEDVANQRVQDYFMHNMVNKAKSSMVPSF